MKVARERGITFEAGPRFRLPALPGERLPPRVFTSAYFDTTDHRLAAAGVALRRRVERGTGLWELTLPGAETPLELEMPGPGAAPPAEFRDLVTAQVRGAALVAAATLRTRRESVLVRDLDGPVAEVVLDTVQVLEGRRVVRRFREVAIQPRGDDPHALTRLAGMLRAAGAVDTDARPRVLQALGLPAPAAAVPPPASSAPADRLKAILAAQLALIIAHDPGTRLGRESEDLHQMRVAVRRLRAALRAGRPMLDAEWAEPLRGELAWLGGALGSVRDLDVMREHLGAEVERLDAADARGARRLLASLDADRAEARRAMREALASPRYWLLLDALEDAARRPKLVEAVVSLEAVAAEEFKQLGRAVVSLGESPSDEELHAVRIKGKRARYAAELAEPEVGRRATRFIRKAKALQDVLGEHQDAVVATLRVRELSARTRSARVALVAGRLIEREQARRLAMRAAFAKQWAKLEKRGRKAWR